MCELCVCMSACMRVYICASVCVYIKVKEYFNTAIVINYLLHCKSVKNFIV